jgi:hypothetical protein
MTSIMHFENSHFNLYNFVDVATCEEANIILWPSSFGGIVSKNRTAPLEAKI